MKLSVILLIFALILVSEARVIEGPYWELADNPSRSLSYRDLLGDWSDNESAMSKLSLAEIEDTLKRSYPSNPGTMKRDEALSELIRLLKVMSGKTGETGRTHPVRFGSGRR